MADVSAVGMPSIQVALNRAKTAIGAVRKDERNTVQNFNFRGVDAVVNAAAPALNEHGIIVTPDVIAHTYDTVEVGKNRTPMGHVTLVVQYTFWGPGGDSVSTSVLAEAMDSGDKACAKAMSVAYRIALLQALNLPTDEPDPDLESHERSTGSAPKAQNRKITEIPKKPQIANLAEFVYSANSVEELREAWKTIGAMGALQRQVTDRDGETTTVQQLLYRRNDELSLSKSPGSPETAPVA